MTAAYSKQGSGKFYVTIQIGRNAFFYSWKAPINFIAFLVCRFVSVAPTSRIWVNAHIGNFLENLLMPERFSTMKAAF